MPARLVTLAVTAVLACAILPASSSGGSCQNLIATPMVKRQLLQTIRRNASIATGPREGSTYYGRCGSTRYALASFSTGPLGYQDQPEAFRRLGGHGWSDRGDTGGELCRAAPRGLLKIWRLWSSSCSQN